MKRVFAIFLAVFSLSLHAVDSEKAKESDSVKPPSPPAGFFPDKSKDQKTNVANDANSQLVKVVKIKTSYAQETFASVDFEVTNSTSIELKSGWMTVSWFDADAKILSRSRLTISDLAAGQHKIITVDLFLHKEDRKRVATWNVMADNLKDSAGNSVTVKVDFTTKR